MQTQKDQRKMPELPIWLENGEPNGDGQKPQAVPISQSGCALATSEGLGIPSDYRLLPTLQSRFTTLINNLSVKHIIQQQMILFHRFFWGGDLTDELFIDVGARGGGERLLKGKRQRKFKMDPAPSQFLFQKVFFFSPPHTNLHQPYFVNRVRTPRSRQISCNLPDLPFMSGAAIFLYPSKCY